MKMKKTNYSILMCFCALLFSCTSTNQKELDLPKNDLGLEQDNSQQISGRFATEIGVLTYLAKSDPQNNSKLTLSVGWGEKQLEAAIRFDNESFQLNGHEVNY